MAEDISITELTDDHYSVAARWLSNPEINKWLYSEWRGRTVTDKLLAVAAMNPKNKLWIVMVRSQPFGLVGLADINTLDSTAMVWSLRGDDDDLRAWTARNRQELAHAIRDAITEGMREGIRHGFEDLKLRSISASIMAPNVMSHRVAHRLGFKKVGVLRKAFRLGDKFVDRVVYDLLPEDWDQG